MLLHCLIILEIVIPKFSHLIGNFNIFPQHYKFQKPTLMKYTHFALLRTQKNGFSLTHGLSFFQEPVVCFFVSLL